jgi:hypothetical protein
LAAIAGLLYAAGIPLSSSNRARDAAAAPLLTTDRWLICATM